MTHLDMKILLGLYIEDITFARWTTASRTTILNRAQEVTQNLIDAQDEMYFSACQDVQVEVDTDSFQFSTANFASTFKTLLHAERLDAGKAPTRARVVNFARRHEEKAKTPADTLVYIQGSKLGVVSPTAAFELRVWYIKKLSDLVDDANVSEVPAELHNFIVLHAAKLIHLSEKRDFSQWEGEYQAELDRLKETSGTRQRAGALYMHEDED